MLDVLELSEVIELIKKHHYSCEESFYHYPFAYKLIVNKNEDDMFLIPRNGEIDENDVHSFRDHLDDLQKIIEREFEKRLIYHTTTARNAISIFDEGYFLPSQYKTLCQFGILWKGQIHNGAMKLYWDRERERLKKLNNPNDKRKCEIRIKILEKLAYEIGYKTFFAQNMSSNFINDAKNQVIFAIDSSSNKLEKMLVFKEKVDDDVIHYYVNEKDYETIKRLKELDIEKIDEEYYTCEPMSIKYIKYIILQDLCDIKYIIEQDNGKFYIHYSYC
ncbi:hypothetical protein [Parageobacillus sp. G301]|uniref:hypothetical protein n=1 Tax=Parageobacillus sp. G301 TaxID=2998290 RepID=UPI0024985F9A|nr:hypothetical protein [Parageobacillus sp. G301]GLH62391.1 hypothetical protein PG301_02310 [Parageobacillus sp. G301]